jgi:phage terminase large subunit-like protein
VQDLRRGGIRATAFNPNKFGDKNQRVSLASSYIKDGLIYLPMLGPDYKKFRSTAQTLVNECIYFPNGRTRDCVDTLSQVILYASSQQLLRHKEDPFEKPTPAQPFKNPYGIEAIEDEYR